MKRLLLGGVVLMCCAPCMAGSSCCAFKLDALGRTMSRIVGDAGETQTLLESFQDTCCTALRSTRAPYARAPHTRAPQCLCETTPITEAGALEADGSYCLANDITGDIDGTSFQVAINLNGHTVTGSVKVGDHGYVHDGRVTDRVIAGSNSRVESVIINAAQGNVSLAPINDVVLRDVVFVHTVATPITMESFESITLDHCVFDSSSSGYFSAHLINNLVMRDVFVNGGFDVWFVSPANSPRLALYNMQITGDFSYSPGNVLNELSIDVWDSSAASFSVASLAVPLFISLHGLVTPLVYITGTGTVPVDGSRIFIDECNCGRIILYNMSNIRCQNTITSAPDDTEGSFNQFAAVDLAWCGRGVFENVQAFNYNYDSNSKGFKVFESKDLLFKNCFATAENNSAFEATTALAITSTNINFYNCVAKGSTYGFRMGEGTSGSVIRCIADGCTNGFVADAAAPMVYASNVACFNAANYDVPTATAPYYDANYTTTAGSWRNINS